MLEEIDYIRRREEMCKMIYLKIHLALQGRKEAMKGHRAHITVTMMILTDEMTLLTT